MVAWTMALRFPCVVSGMTCFALMSCSTPGGSEERPSAALKGLAPKSDPAEFADYRRLMNDTKRVEGRMVAGELGSVDRLLTFDRVGAWTYVDGLQGIPADVKALDGLTVVMVGYLLPLDVDSLESLIVESPTHMEVVGGPPTNRMVRVVTTAPPDGQLFGPPVMVVGKFSVRAAIADGYCVDIYQIDAQRVESVGDGMPPPSR